MTETAASKLAHDTHEEWEPDWIEGYFVAELRCRSRKCGEVHVVAGDHRVSGDYENDEYNNRFISEFRLRWASPPLPILDIPTRTPTSVSEAITAATAIVWADPDSAANRLRVAVEDLLTSFKVARWTSTKGKKRRLVSTHERIERFRQIKPEAAEALMAVKWIGNDGSHNSGLSAEDVLEGIELFGFALRLLFDESDRLRAKRIAEINRKKRSVRSPR